MPTSRPRKKQQARGVATEQKVLIAAEELFSREGIEATQVGRIIEASGVSVGSFYHHFGSKEAVLSRLIESFCERAREEVDALQLDGASPEETLRQITSATVHQFREHPNLYRAVTGQIGQTPGLWEPMRRLRRYYEARLLAELGDYLRARGIADPSDAVQRVMQVVLALLTHSVVFESGPITLQTDDTEADVFAIAHATLEAAAQKSQARGNSE